MLSLLPSADAHAFIPGADAPYPLPADTADTAHTGGSAPRGRLIEVGPGEPGREAVEDFIRAIYARRHGAQVRQFAPRLVALHDGERLVAAAGFRFATQPLFLERYLDAPIETALARQIGTAPSRDRIVEVGHLAAMPAGAGRQLILQLGPHLAGLRAQWVVGTLTQELRSLFNRLGVAPLALAPADPSRLGEQAQDWGRYYSHAPAVLAANLPQALRRLAQRRPRSTPGGLG